MTGGGRGHALFVGSVPLGSSEEVFRAAATLGTQVRRIPDGETGERLGWVGWQANVMAANPSLELVPQPANDYAPLRLFRLKADADAANLTFGSLGYADAAIASWQTFEQLQLEGAIPAAARFQVSLPTPMASVAAFVEPGAHATVEPAYERQMLHELAQICAVVPHERLAIQWDVAVEFGILEGVFPTALDEATRERELLDRLVRLGEQVPVDVELGYHLCYGDYGHQHFKEPEDTTLLVRVANALAARVQRSIEWIHLPVPRDRDDAAYYAPLAGLQLSPGTELYLGLVHMTDGLEGAQRRVAAAQEVVSDFGVATECGFGRRPTETVHRLIELHGAVLAEMQEQG